MSSGRDPEETKRGFQAAAMKLAQSQFAMVLQTAFMMWMLIGNQLNPWTIFIFLQMGTAPIMKLFSVGTGKKGGSKGGRSP